MLLNVNKKAKKLLSTEQGVSFFDIDNTKKASILESLNAIDNLLGNDNEFSKVYEQVMLVSKAVKGEMKNGGFTKADVNNEVRKRVKELGETAVALLELRDKNRLTKSVISELNFKIVDDKLFVSAKQYELLKEKDANEVDVKALHIAEYNVQKSIEIKLEDFFTGLFDDAESSFATNKKLAIPFGKILASIDEELTAGKGLRILSEEHGQRYDVEVGNGSKVLERYLTVKGLLKSKDKKTK